MALLSNYCDEFLVHGVDVEGKRCGIEEDLVALLGMYSPIPVTYAGGVRSLDDLNLVEAIGKGRVCLPKIFLVFYILMSYIYLLCYLQVDCTVGSALDIFGGELSYEEVVRWHYERNSI